MVRISLCMIVRDEEATLARCLESVEGVVDEVCVLDTGSQDATVAIAERHKARVGTFAWCDDFSAARNASLEMATGDWILVLDADEVLLDPGQARAQLDAFISRNEGAAGHVLIQSELGQGETSLTNVTRFFPRHTHWTFAGKVHEQVLQRGSTPRRHTTGVVAAHSGYAADALARKSKLARNERLLRAILESDGVDAYTAYQLGRTLALGERHAEALEAFELAVANVQDDAPYLAHLFESAATCMRALGHSQQALDWLSNMEDFFRDRADTRFLLALLAMDTGDLERARTGFEHCLSLDGSVPAGGASWPGASSWGAAANLGVMYECSGDARRARQYYRLALDARADYAPSLAGLERLERAQAPA